MKYAVVVHHEEGSAYGVTVPGLAGCFSAGDSFDEAFDNVVEAIEFHLEGLAEQEMDIPRAETVDAHMDNPDFAGGTWGFVDIDLTPYLGKTEKINVTLPSAVIRRIDAKHKNRSRFLAEAALKALA
ncbi:MAG: type II toxin-antitoxin system HicB family antitoxin [Halioglobus sp.]